MAGNLGPGADTEEAGLGTQVEAGLGRPQVEDTLTAEDMQRLLVADKSHFVEEGRLPVEVKLELPHNQ